MQPIQGKLPGYPEQAWLCSGLFWMQPIQGKLPGHPEQAWLCGASGVLFGIQAFFGLKSESAEKLV